MILNGDDVRAPRLAPLFGVFAATYFLAALVRSAMATLSPAIAAEFALGPSQIGTVGASFFLAFSAMQLPMGRWLDRHGPRQVMLALVGIAACAMAAFASAGSFAQLVVTRAACGIGFSACLMAPLTGYRRWFDPPTQLRLSAWMLMASSLGAMASTLPLQWAAHALGWRVVFAALAAALVAALFAIRRVVPRWSLPTRSPGAPPVAALGLWRHPYFRRMAPIGFFCFGGQSALLTLWVGPWLSTVAHCTPTQVSLGLFTLNFLMLLSYAGWGLCAPRFARAGVDADRLMAWVFPLALPALAVLVLWDGATSTTAIVLFACHCVPCGVLSLSTPAMALRLPPEAAGRALSGYNIVIFLGVAFIQWGVGAMAQALQAHGWAPAAALQAALGTLALAETGAWLWMVMTKSERLKQA